MSSTSLNQCNIASAQLLFCEDELGTKAEEGEQSSNIGWEQWIVAKDGEDGKALLLCGGRSGSNRFSEQLLLYSQKETILISFIQ